MLMLSSNVDYTTPELADLLEITERSIYRYIRSFNLLVNLPRPSAQAGAVPAGAVTTAWKLHGANRLPS